MFFFYRTLVDHLLKKKIELGQQKHKQYNYYASHIKILCSHTSKLWEDRDNTDTYFFIQIVVPYSTANDKAWYIA